MIQQHSYTPIHIISSWVVDSIPVSLDRVGFSIFGFCESNLLASLMISSPWLHIICRLLGLSTPCRSDGGRFVRRPGMLVVGFG